MNSTVSSSFPEIVTELLANPQDREQYEALLAARETARNESHAAGNLQSKEEHDAEIAKLREDQATALADKDTAHDETIARMKEDYEAAIITVNAQADALLAKTITEAAQAAAAAKAEADAKIEQGQRDLNHADSVIDAITIDLADRKAERDALKATLAEEESRQDQLAAAATSFADALVALAGQGKALATEAGKKLAQKQEENRLAAIADAQAQLDRLKAKGA